MADTTRSARFQVAATSFLALFSIVGLTLYGLPFFYDFWVNDFGWTRGQVTSGNALSKLLVGPLFGFTAGWVIDRIGPRRVMIAGILMAGAALMGLSRASAIGMFYFFYLFNALGYVCGGPLPNQVLLSRWFDKSRGRAMGFAYLGIGVGGALVPLVSLWLIQRFGWQDALFTLGILIILIPLPMVLLIKQLPDAQARATASPIPIRSTLAGTPFYLLAIGSMCSIGAVGGTYQNLKLYLSNDRGFSQPESASLLSLVLVSSLAGRILMGWLADRRPKKDVMLVIYALVAASILLLLFAPSSAALYLFAVLFGIGLGGDYMIIPLMAAELFGVKSLGRLMGIILTADGVAEAVVPMLVGRLRDASATYATGFTILFCLALAGAFAVSLLPRTKTETYSQSGSIQEPKTFEKKA